MFPILKLPSVALRQILDTLEFKDLVLLSLCSTRSCQIFKLTRSKTPKLKLYVDSIHQTVRMPSMDEHDILLGAVKIDPVSHSPKGLAKIRRYTVSIGAVRDRYTQHFMYMSTFWNDPIHGFQEVMNHLRDLFRVDIHFIHFNGTSLWILDWIQKVQNGVQVAETEKDRPLSFREYGTVIKSCNARELCLYAYPKNNFKYTGGMKDHERIHISYGEWLTLENLLEINAPDIYIERSELTSNDLNQLLKKWLAGGLSKLKYLSLGLSRTAWGPEIAEVVLNGLNVETKPRRTYHRKYEWNHDFKDNKELRRPDGVTASIKVTPQSFTLAVWPDFNA